MLAFNKQPAYVLTVMIAVLALVASGGGLLVKGLYRDNTLVTAVWQGNDIVTLAVVIPVMLVALYFSMGGSVKGQLVLLGMLDYMLYNYAFYLFGASFNSFFLIYALLLALSIFALIFSILKLDVQLVANKFKPKTPRRLIGGYLLFIGCSLSVVYAAQSIGFIVTGKLPPIIEATGHPTSVIFALDLVLLIPIQILAGYWLFKRHPWGYILATISNVKGAAYTLVLTVGSVSAFRAGISSAAAELPLWVTLTIFNSIATWLLMRSINTKDNSLNNFTNSY